MWRTAVGKAAGSPCEQGKREGEEGEEEGVIGERKELLVHLREWPHKSAMGYST